MSALNRLKRAWKLSRYSDQTLDLTESVVAVKEAQGEAVLDKSKPNGAILEDMTDAEYVTWEREQDNVWKAFMDSVRSL